MTNKERLEQLEQQIATLRTEQAQLLRDQTRYEVDLWHGRMQDLEVQAHLAGMEAHDKLQPLLDRLHTAWDDVRKVFPEAKSKDES